MRAHMAIITATLAVATTPATAAGQTTRASPARHHPIASARMTAGTPRRTFEIVAYAAPDDARRGAAPARPLVVYETSGGGRRPIARNDQVVMRRNEGGQCDPFDPEDAGGHIVAKGRYFTVENGVACGQHWTSYVTFRLDDRLGFVFDNARREAWRLNVVEEGDDAEALVRDGPPSVTRADPRRPVRLADWRRR